MYVLGITGGIGAGKSSVLQYLRDNYGAYTVETDDLAHRLMASGTACWKDIVGAFGDVTKPDGEIDRKKLGNVVLHDREKLQQLDNIVHPAVRKWLEQDIAEKEKEGKVRFYVIEAALLIQEGYRNICREIWDVETDRETRIRRICESRGISRERAEAFLANQENDAFYRNGSDRVIFNGDDFSETASRIDRIMKLI